MINHIRTLLVNTNTASDALVIDTGFRAVTIPAWLSQVQVSLIGKPRQQSRLELLQRLLHLGQVRYFTLLPDQRITYQTFYDNPLPEDLLRRQDLAQIQLLLPQVQVAASAAGTRLFSFKSELSSELGKTLQSLWLTGLSQGDRLAAAALAVAYCIDDVRLNRGR